MSKNWHCPRCSYECTSDDDKVAVFHLCLPLGQVDPLTLTRAEETQAWFLSNWPTPIEVDE